MNPTVTLVGFSLLLSFVAPQWPLRGHKNLRNVDKCSYWSHRTELKGPTKVERSSLHKPLAKKYYVFSDA